MAERPNEVDEAQELARADAWQLAQVMARGAAGARSLILRLTSLCGREHRFDLT